MNRQLLTANMYRYGEDIAILQNNREKVVTKGFIEPLRYNNKKYFGGLQTADGYIEDKHYRLVCLKKADLTIPNTIIERGDSKFCVNRADDVFFDGEVLYVSAILTKFIEVKEDSYDEQC